MPAAVHGPDSAQQTILSDGYMPQPSLSLAAYRARLGQVVGQSEWVHIEQPMINTFAALTGDNQYIHIDPERARQTPLGGTVAHGFLTLAIIGGLGPKTIPPIEGTKIGFNYGFDRIRFVTPVPSGSWIRAAFAARNVEQRSAGKIMLAFDVTVEIEGEAKPALVAQWLTLMVKD
jgi:acyl dehydratase